MSVYEDDGQKLGVVFHVDPDAPGRKKILSAAGGVMNWATTNGEWRIRLYKPDYDYVHTVVTASDAYKADPDAFPAVKFCEQMRKDYGGNWHVPSIDELNILFNAYYGHPYDTPVSEELEYTDDASRKAAAYFDGLLEAAGGEALLEKSSEYWICGQNSGGDLQYVDMKKYYHSHSVQTVEKYLRCVRDVDVRIPDDAVEYPQTDIGRLIKGDMSTRIIDVPWDTTYNVTAGLDYYKMKVVTDAQEKLDVCLLRTDMSKGLEIKAAISAQTTSSSWHKQVLSEMAAQMSTPSHPVYAMINADFCDNREPIRPRGPVHCGGYMWTSTYSQDSRYPEQGLSYVGVTYDGELRIGSSEDYDSVKNTLKECTGGGRILLKDTKIVAGGSARDPRTAIGYTSSNIVWMLVVDGRHNGTEGMTYTEVASIFQGVGCQIAVNLDGGGSTEMLALNPATGDIEICNWPSDPTDGEGGAERARPTAWAVVKK